MGATEPDVDYDAFARDLADFFAGLDQLQGSLVVAAAPGGGGVAGGAPGGIPGAGGVAASLEIDQAAVNRLALEMVRIGESHGVRFPPDFGEPRGRARRRLLLLSGRGGGWLGAPPTRLF